MSFGLQMLFAIGARPVIDIANLTVTDEATAPASANALYTLNTNGNKTGGGTWITPIGFSSLYECMATVTSGSLTSGTAGSWLGLESSRSWTRNQPGPGTGTSTCIFTLQIRDKATATVQDTATITLTATVSA